MKYRKAILKSITPREMLQVLNGELTALPEKKKPKIDLPVEVFLHCKRGEELHVTVVKDSFILFIKSDSRKLGGFSIPLNNNVIAKFRLERIEEESWPITELEIIDPLPLFHFLKICPDPFEYCPCCKHAAIIVDNAEECVDYGFFTRECNHYVKRAPGNWMYVRIEEKEEQT